MKIDKIVIIGIALVANSLGHSTKFDRILPHTYTVGQKVNDAFRFIGSAPSGLLSTNAMSSKSFYFTSEVNKSWKEAQAMCVTVLGYNASLVSFEMEGEQGNVSSLLPVGVDRPDSYWTGGHYQEALTNYIWERGVIIDSSAPWGVDEPLHKSPNYGVAMTFNSNWTYSSVDLSEPMPFICEYVEGSSKDPAPCFNTNDLIIMLDSSGSISVPDYNLAKENFVEVLAVQWAAWNQTKVSLSIFASTVDTRFDLRGTLTKEELIDEIRRTPKLGGGTASDLALDRILEEFKKYQRFVQKNVVFLTDGQSNYPAKTAEAARRIHEFRGKTNETIQVYSVGIGQGIVVEELKTISGNDDHVFTASSFSELENLLKPMSLIMCGNQPYPDPDN